MNTEFDDGKERPDLSGNWTRRDLDRKCRNCGRIFGQHDGYKCPISEEE